MLNTNRARPGSLSPKLKRPNVVLLVLDTLREDHAGDLEKLRGMGFVRFDAVATSSWTLPSHVSMFTGELPSSHGVREYPGVEWSHLMGISKERMARGSLLDAMKERGYTTYGSSANLFVTPQFGFVFDHYKVFDQHGELKQEEKPAQQHGFFRRFVPLLFRPGAAGGVLRWLAVAVGGRALSLARAGKLEKGSRPILDSARSTSFKEPFFAFINFMEAHQPYVWWPLDTLVVRLAIVGLKPSAGWWKAMYPRFARLAVSRGVEAVSLFLPYDPLIIVVSDHGQLLGDNHRYGHGFSLDDELLKVPLLVRFPSGTPGPEATGPLVSIAALSKLIQDVADGKKGALGSDAAFAETWESGNYEPEKPGDKEVMHHIFVGRVKGGGVKVFGKKGSVLVNRDTGEVAEASPGLTGPEARELAEKAPRAATALDASSAAMPSEDEQVVLDRLKKLGYD